VIRIRGGSGLGDAIYQRPIVDHFIGCGEEVEVCSVHSDVFIGSGAVVSEFRRSSIDVLAHYTAGKQRADTTQWQDVCNSAGVPGLVLRFEWSVQNIPLVHDLKAMAKGKPIVLVHGGRAPMARTDGFGAELLPKRAAFDAALDALEDCFLVEVGKGTELYPLRADVDLNGRTTVADLIDIAWICDAVVGQCSFVVPLAECFDKPLLAIWAAHGMEHTRHPYIKSITPQKVLSKPSSSFVVDDWDTERIQEAARALCVLA
jgi:hypothetical protein